ncbi:MAG: helix-turn-helix domain-containing protein [Candidatus Riflebacteria bacterium]|nr:helix-turn-helix domain-containing protein [Candidatus Riflebacteria bacterium]
MPVCEAMVALVLADHYLRQRALDPSRVPELGVQHQSCLKPRAAATADCCCLSRLWSIILVSMITRTAVKPGRPWRFVDRRDELTFLERRWETGQPQCLVVYGKRRVGKTELLKQFIRGKPSVYFVADRRPERELLTELGQRIGQHLGDDYIARRGFEGWLDLFAMLASRLTRPTALIIDEFPYLVEANPAIPSLFQKAWDEHLRNVPVCLVLCGSSIAMMEAHTLSHGSPLFGRRTGDLQVAPLDYFAARGFFPQVGAERFVELFSILGGMPMYLLQFDPSKKLKQNVRDQILSRGAFLHREVEFLVREELREPRNYMAILRAIAEGQHKFSEISARSGLEKNVLTRYLQVLAELRLIRREVPITEGSPFRSKKGLFRIDDPFVAFWFQHVHPFASELELGNTAPSLRRMDEVFDGLAAATYESVARTIIRREPDVPFPLSTVGRWWNRQAEIDVIGLDPAAAPGILFGEAKWSRKPVGSDVYRRLREKAELVDWGGPSRREVFALFSRSGFTRNMFEVAAADGVLLYHVDRRVR